MLSLLRLTVSKYNLDQFRTPVGKIREKTEERSLQALSALKNSVVTVKAALLCLAHVLIIAMARVNNDPKYKLYKDGKSLKQHVEDHLKASVVDLSNGGGFEEFQQFQQYLSDYKVIVFDGLHVERVMFSGNSLLAKKLYLI
jgi:hypothetical protein